MVEQTQVGVDEGDPQLVAGLDHDVVSSRARRGGDELHSTLHRQGAVQGSEGGNTKSSPEGAGSASPSSTSH